MVLLKEISKNTTVYNGMINLFNLQSILLMFRFEPMYSMY